MDGIQSYESAEVEMFVVNQTGLLVTDQSGLLNFHSGLGYLGFTQDFLIPVDSPAYSRNWITVPVMTGGKKMRTMTVAIPYMVTRSTYIGSHSSAQRPISLLTDLDTKEIVNASMPLTISGDSLRFITLFVTSTGAWIKELIYVGTKGDLPAFNKTYKCSIAEAYI